MMDEQLLIEATTAAVHEASVQTQQHSSRDDHNNTDPPKQLVAQCLDTLLRVTLEDGRLIQGTLDCYDYLGNMILSGASDITHRPTRSTPIRMGTVLVPGRVSRRIKKLSNVVTNNTNNNNTAAQQSKQCATETTNVNEIPVHRDSDQKTT